jgi:hypothetical protein
MRPKTYKSYLHCSEKKIPRQTLYNRRKKKKILIQKKSLSSKTKHDTEFIDIEQLNAIKSIENLNSFVDSNENHTYNHNSSHDLTDQTANTFSNTQNLDDSFNNNEGNSDNELLVNNLQTTTNEIDSENLHSTTSSQNVSTTEVINDFEISMLVLTFKYRHRLNNVAVGDIIKMLNLTNKELKIPTLYKVCKNINKYSEVSIDSKRIMINGKEVVCLSIIDQTKQLLTRKSRQSYNSTDAKKYIHFTFSLFTDGVSPFKSSNVSLWPIYLTINELHYSDRFKLENVILGKFYSKIISMG